VLAGAAACQCEEEASLRKSNQPAVVVVDPEDADQPAVAREEEPNDSRRRAQALGAEARVAGSFRATDEKRGDIDWYRVEIAEPDQILTTTLAGVPDLDVVLEAFSSEGERLVKVNNTGEGGGEVLVNLAPDPGMVLLRVREAKRRHGPGHYRIGFELRPSEPGEEREPNWKAELATPFALDEEATGYLGWRTDNDWYRVDVSGVSPAARLRVELDGVDDVRANLSLRAPSGAVIQDRWGAAGESLTLANVALPTGVDHLFVVVRCTRDTNVESRYSLRVLSAVPPWPTEAEPNDVPPQATPLSPGKTMAGILGGGRDRDCFRVTASAPVAVRVEVKPPLGMDVAVAALDQTGEALWGVNEGEAREVEVMPSVWILPGQRDVVRVRAAGHGGPPDVSSYQIRISRIGGGSWEQEPNDNDEQAHDWPEGVAQINGYLHPEGDVDTIAIRGTSSTQSLSVSGVNGVTLEAQLLQADGVVVSSETGTTGGAVSLAVPPRAGEAYLVRISAVSGGNNPDASYVIGRRVSP
jgi:hypothetical protein